MSAWEREDQSSVIDAITQYKERILADTFSYKDKLFGEKLDARAELIGAFTDKYGEVDLPTICLGLRMSCNGASEPWGDQLLRDTVDYLGERLKLWIVPIDAIDYCVYVMCKEAIHIGERELRNRQEQGYELKGLEGEGWK